MDTIIKRLGFEHTVRIHADRKELPEPQIKVLEQIESFCIDEVYFCSDGQNSFPAVFIKEVTIFDNETLKEIAEIQRKIWNYKKVIFLYVYNGTEIRIYNCSERPIFIKNYTDVEQEIQKIELERSCLTDNQKLETLNLVFSSVAVDTGIIWTIKEAEQYRRKIKMQRRVDKYLIESMIRAAKKLQHNGLSLDLIHKIMIRSLFLLYLEDRGATDERFYDQIKPGAKTYFDLLNDVDSTFALFRKLDKHFNGNVFTVEEDETIEIEHLKIIRSCFISGYEDSNQTELFKDWRLFNFSIIQIELLSEIYENFLAELEPDKKHQTGTFYTPPALVELMLNEKLPIDKNNDNYDVKILDPACGSGIFLVESFKRLVKRYENKHKEKLINFNNLKGLLTDHIFGIEIYSKSIKVAAFSLYLALLENLNPRTLWQDKQLPYLINDPKEPFDKQGKNLFCRDTIQDNPEIDDVEFDLVIGNPPFGTKNLLPSIRSYCNRQGFAKEMALPFLHKAIKFSTSGDIALIFNTKLLTNTGSTYQRFRKWLFNECYVEKIYNFSILRNASKHFGGQLFGSATGPICIAFYRKAIPTNPNDRIIYYAPKTFVKSNIIEGVVIESSDVKFLPRIECQNPGTKIWKVAMWGNLQDLLLLKDLSNKYLSLNQFFNKYGLNYGVGFELSSPSDTHNTEINKLPIHTPNNIEKYITPKPTKRINAEKFRRLGKVEAYQTSHIILNEGIKVIKENKNLTIVASFVDYNSAFTKGIVGIYSENEHRDLLKIITLFLNSDFVRYFSFLTTSSWGIERDVIKHKEVFEIPYLFCNISMEEKEFLVDKFDKIEKAKQNFCDISLIEKEINQLIFNRLSNHGRIILQDAININLDLFHNKEKSKALLPVISLEDYSAILCDELNNFLESQSLFVYATNYSINRNCPLAMVRLTFSSQKEKTIFSSESVSDELRILNKKILAKESFNIYFRKRLNFYDRDDIYLIRPNQLRFWSQTMGMEDASELILEILSKD
jgi:hypothetical protein